MAAEDEPGDEDDWLTSAIEEVEGHATEPETISVEEQPVLNLKRVSRNRAQNNQK